MTDAIVDKLLTLTASEWTLAVGGLVTLAAAFPRITGPLRESWEGLLASKRRAAELRDDADIKDLRRQVENLAAELRRQSTVIAEMRAEMQRRDTALHDHYPWDVRAYQLIIAKIGKEAIEPPPPLWPSEPDASITPSVG